MIIHGVIQFRGQHNFTVGGQSTRLSCNPLRSSVRNRAAIINPGLRAGGLVAPP